MGRELGLTQPSVAEMKGGQACSRWLEGGQDTQPSISARQEDLVSQDGTQDSPHLCETRE